MEKERNTQSEESTATCSKVSILFSSSGGTDSECNKATTSIVQETSLPKCQKAAKNVVTSQLAMVLDRTKVNDRSAAYVLIETVHSIRQDPKEF